MVMLYVGMDTYIGLFYRDCYIEEHWSVIGIEALYSEEGSKFGRYLQNIHVYCIMYIYLYPICGSIIISHTIVQHILL